MKKTSYLILHKTEWDRLHRRPDDTNRLTDQRDEYFRKLVEKSQSWIKTWSDTLEGHVEQVMKQKLKHHAEEVETLKKWLKAKTKESTEESIQRARELIFQDSCYGKQLISGLLASKTLEERDIQLEFQRRIKEQMLELETETLTKLNLDQCSFNLDKEEEIKLKKIKENTELAEFNKAMHETEIERKNKLRQENIKGEMDDIILMQELLEKEKQREKKYNDDLRYNVAQYANEQKLIRERKEAQKQRDEEKIQKQSIELEQKHCKIRKVLNEIHSAKHDTEQFKKNFKLVKEHQDKQKLRYDEIVQKGIQNHEKRITKKEKEDLLKKKSERETLCTLAKINKATAKEIELERLNQKMFNKCAADRQSILTKSYYERRNKQMTQEKEPIGGTFLHPCTTLQEQLRMRSSEPSGWNGLQAAHAKFADYATGILHESRHKQFVKKVIEEYKKVNCLDCATLPIPSS